MAYDEEGEGKRKVEKHHMNLDITPLLEQRLTLSQNQIQSLHILEMNNYELKEFIEKEEMENPLIEVVHSTEMSSQRGVSYGDDSYYEIPDRKENDIIEYLKAQINFNKLNEIENRVVEFLLYSIDHMGYIKMSRKEIVELTGASIEEASKCLSLIKTLEPTGIGASCLEECLLLQLTAKGYRDPLLEKLIKCHLEDVAYGRFAKIAKSLGTNTNQVKDYVKTIKGLNPYPTNGFDQENTEYIIPDIIFSYEEKHWSIRLNDSWVGEVRINSQYHNLPMHVQDEHFKEYYDDRIKQAKNLYYYIEQRRRTILQISSYLLQYQIEFFEERGSLKPLSMRQVSEALNMNESTVSRAIKDKYIQCPKGTFIMKSFFANGMKQSTDGMSKDISVEAIKTKIRDIINSECKEKPYSDMKLSELLRKEGIQISRRTVAKYRSEIGIKGALER